MDTAVPCCISLSSPWTGRRDRCLLALVPGPRLVEDDICLGLKRHVLLLLFFLTLLYVSLRHLRCADGEVDTDLL